VAAVNIVVLFIDTLRYDHVSANPSPDPTVDTDVATPNLDRVAERGYAFDRAFPGSFPTVPLRTDAMTGRYGGPFHEWAPLDFDVPTFPERLAEDGYVTQLIHDTPHLVNGGNRFDVPFTAWTPVRGAEVDRSWVTDDWSWLPNWERDERFASVEMGDTEVIFESHALPRYVQSNRGRRRHEEWNVARLFRTGSQFLRDNSTRDNFLLWLDCFDPHEPWDAPPEYVARHDPGGDGTIDPRSFIVRNDPDLPESAREHVAAQYKAKVEFMDRWLGEFLDTLDATGLRENTALLVMGDHGTNVGEFPERGFGKSAPPREREAHVPLFLDVPDAGSGRVDAIVQAQDIFATVAEIADGDVAVPEGADSNDLLAVARGDHDPRELALTGRRVDAWESDRSATLCYATDGEHSLGFAADPSASELRPFGGHELRDDASARERLWEQARDELVRRGLDDDVAGWLDGGSFPTESAATTTDRGPPGYRNYWDYPFPE
jgi:arylsulfatase A-like enzyme